MLLLSFLFTCCCTIHSLSSPLYVPSIPKSSLFHPERPIVDPLGHETCHANETWAQTLVYIYIQPTDTVTPLLVSLPLSLVCLLLNTTTFPRFYSQFSPLIESQCVYESFKSSLNNFVLLASFGSPSSSFHCSPSRARILCPSRTAILGSHG